MPNVRTALLPAPAPIKESVRAEIRVMVKRILRKYGYPPDKQEKAIRTVLEQVEVRCKHWA